MIYYTRDIANSLFPYALWLRKPRWNNGTLTFESHTAFEKYLRFSNKRAELLGLPALKPGEIRKVKRLKIIIN